MTKHTKNYLKHKISPLLMAVLINAIDSFLLGCQFTSSEQVCDGSSVLHGRAPAQLSPSAELGVTLWVTSLF